MAYKWTAPRTWVAGEKPPAATLNSHIRDNLEALNGYAVKSADESVTSSTTLQDDNHLTHTIPQAGTYVFDLQLFCTSATDAAGDIKFAFTFPTGTCHFKANGPDAGITGGTIQTGQWAAIHTATSGTSAIAMGLSSAMGGIEIRGILIATASGTLTLQWAQSTSDANASTLKAGSHMLIRQTA